MIIMTHGEPKWRKLASKTERRKLGRMLARIMIGIGIAGISIAGSVMVYYYALSRGQMHVVAFGAACIVGSIGLLVLGSYILECLN